jgi:hypothetical protein
MSTILPALAAVSLAAALEDVTLAIRFLERHEAEHHDFDRCDIEGILRTLRICRGFLRVGRDVNRTALAQPAIEKFIRDFRERDHEFPDLAAASVAAAFAAASLGEAVEVIDEDHRWAGRLVAAEFVTLMIHNQIEDAIKAKPFAGAGFFLSN